MEDGIFLGFQNTKQVAFSRAGWLAREGMGGVNTD